MSAGAVCKLSIVRGSGYADWLRNYRIGAAPSAQHQQFLECGLYAP
jgi:hypothetical protein